MKNIIEKARNFKYTSFNYIDEEDLAGTVVDNISEGYICLYKKQLNRIQLYWAANSENELIKGLEKSMDNISKGKKEKFFIEFVPEELIEELEKNDFRIVSEWTDFWKKDLSLENIELKQTYEIREAMAKDYDVISEIAESCVGYSREFAMGLVHKDFIEEWVKDINSTILVTEINDTVVGAIFLNIYGQESEKGAVLWIRELCVNPEYHSKGIAQALLYKGIKGGELNGAKRSFLSVDIENMPAIKIYERFGYRKSEERGQINMEGELYEFNEL